MMPLVLDVPIEAEIDELQIGGIDAEEVRRLFDFLEFRALYDRLTDVLDFDGGAADGRHRSHRSRDDDSRDPR